VNTRNREAWDQRWDEFESGDYEERNDALKSLAAIDPRKSQIVELRYFGGLSVREMAEVLKVSPRQVTREWNLARAWLHRELSNTVTSDKL
jgi:RNA polymerase sigma factor (sigma-70 family)